jgi:uncharacterized protein YdiU (UPF0061 family)
MKTLHELHFDNRFIKHLPEDSNNDNACRQVFNACYSHVLPQKVSRPKLVCYSPEVAQLLDLAAHVCESEEFAQIFAGNQLAKGMQPYTTDADHRRYHFGNQPRVALVLWSMVFFIA